MKLAGPNSHPTRFPSMTSILRHLLSAGLAISAPLEAQFPDDLMSLAAPAEPKETPAAEADAPAEAEASAEEAAEAPAEEAAAEAPAEEAAADDAAEEKSE